MTTRPIRTLVMALASSDASPLGAKLRSVLGIPFLGGMILEQLDELDATPASEIAATLRHVSAFTGTLAAQLEADVALTGELLLESLERSFAASDERSPSERRATLRAIEGGSE